MHCISGIINSIIPLRVHTYDPTNVDQGEAEVIIDSPSKARQSIQSGANQSLRRIIQVHNPPQLLASLAKTQITIQKI